MMMSFTEAVRNFYRRYVDFQGRSQRSEYWWFQLYFYAVFIAIIIIGVLLGGDFETDETDGIALAMLMGLGLWLLGHFIGLIALSVRRFHDLGQTGWLVLVFAILGAIPIIGGLASLAQIVWFIFPGNQGPNRYGPDPLGYDPDPIFETDGF